MSTDSTAKFVRGKYQIARYEPGSDATGRRLTEHEVRESYGDAVFREIDENRSAILLSREGAIEESLRLQREELEITQEQLAKAAGVEVGVVENAESDASRVGFRELEQLAFLLALDPAKLATDERAGSDPELGVRLRVLEQGTTSSSGRRLSPAAVLRFSEAASIIRTQCSLQNWLGKDGEVTQFSPSSDYGAPAWRVGYQLAEQARGMLGLDRKPINSMRDLVESRLGIPVVQVGLPERIAGATIASNGLRGIVLNTKGANANVWIRRATLAHELAHILFDPDERLESVRVDTYEQVERNALQESASPDPVEQRANAFAVEFLAPESAIKEVIPAPGNVTAAKIETVMSHFGIGKVAARYHVRNVWWGQADLPRESGVAGQPSDEQRAAEDFTLDYFQPSKVPEQRRGRFAGLVAKALDGDLITEDTAAQFLGCGETELVSSLPFLRELAV